MGMKILLGFPPTSSAEDKLPLNFPMGILCLASFIEKKGVEVKVHHDYPYWSIIKLIKDYKPDVVGLSCNSGNFSNCFELSKAVKAIDRNIYVILGGIHATFFHKEILKRIDSVDMIVRGEGEQTFWEVLNCIKNGRPEKELRHVKGVSYRADDALVVTPNRPFISTLDILPPLPYHFIDMSKVEVDTYPGSWPIYASRGCYYNCNYCASSFEWGQACRYKGSKRVVKEIQSISKKYRINKIFFYDSTFTANKQKVYEICKHLADSKLKISWGCNTRVDCIDRDLLNTMKKAGCERIIYGVDSFSDRMLKKMNKNYKANDAVKVLNYTNKLGITTLFFLILGFPGENDDTLRETKEAIKKLNQGVRYENINIFQLLPGSRIYKTAVNNGWINDDAWFSGFGISDSSRIFHTRSFTRKLYEAKEEIERGFDKSNNENRTYEV